MHCSNPKCFEDSCKGECLEVREEERLWPWYRYDGEQPEEIKVVDLNKPSPVT